MGRRGHRTAGSEASDAVHTLEKFHWTAALAGLFAIFITVLFGFIYFKIDDYLIRVPIASITTQIGFFAGLPRDRLIGAL